MLIAAELRLSSQLLYDSCVVADAGFIKFREPYYMMLVKKRVQVGSICGHAIYKVGDSELITVPHSSVQTSVAMSKMEQR